MWRFFISHYYTPWQTAGIMGNLKQEHNFLTDGDGLAQWTGARLEKLKQRGSWQDLSVQLEYLLEELNTTESRANQEIKATSSVQSATVAFQDYFERCGDCRESQRIQYAIDIFNRH